LNVTDVAGLHNTMSTDLVVDPVPEVPVVVIDDDNDTVPDDDDINITDDDDINITDDDVHIDDDVIPDINTTDDDVNITTDDSEKDYTSELIITGLAAVAVIGMGIVIVAIRKKEKPEEVEDDEEVLEPEIVDDSEEEVETAKKAIPIIRTKPVDTVSEEADFWSKVDAVIEDAAEEPVPALPSAGIAEISEMGDEGNIEKVINMKEDITTDSVVNIRLDSP